MAPTARKDHAFPGGRQEGADNRLTHLILNVLPPARTDTPSAASSVLQGFLRLHGIESRIIYWNLLLADLLPHSIQQSAPSYFPLLPYLYALAGEYGDPIGQSKANALIKAHQPFRDLRNDHSDYWQSTQRTLEAIIQAELEKLSENPPKLFGISCRYEQWIPGALLAHRIKHHFPQARIVLGGITGAEKAEALLKTCAHFDYAIWGEGEYPLLELCRSLENGVPAVDRIPRLVYRNGDSIVFSNASVGPFHDLNHPIPADHDDYFDYLAASGRKGAPVIFPLESSRGCTWNQCRFCVYSEGQQNRKKAPELLRDEILFLIQKYQARYFAFMDNDIACNDPERLEKILDDLAAIRRSHGTQMMAEIVPKNLGATLLKKLARAGFHQIHFGYESLSEVLLRKMRKKHSFSDNIFFIKFARKYQIKLPSANIITGIIGEEDADILECMDNLHFLRFFLDKNRFAHNLIPLQVAKPSWFYRNLPPENLVQWNDNPLYQILPDAMIKDIDRFALFDFSASARSLWSAFAQLNQFYYAHDYRYRLSLEAGETIYQEYFDGEPLTEYPLTAMEYAVLQETNTLVPNLQHLKRSLGRKHGLTIDEFSLGTVLNRLKERHLVYFRGHHKALISVIDTDQAEDSASIEAAPR